MLLGGEEMTENDGVTARGRIDKSSSSSSSSYDVRDPNFGAGICEGDIGRRKAALE